MGTIVTPPNANPNLEFADIGTVVAPACSSKMISDQYRLDMQQKKELLHCIGG
jgi:hypothetical protein